MTISNTNPQLRGFYFIYNMTNNPPKSITAALFYLTNTIIRLNHKMLVWRLYCVLLGIKNPYILSS
nr:MAG TPA: hypothetical protein [Caudoviricetes sp.]